jgi:hypothetical protein
MSKRRRVGRDSASPALLFVSCLLVVAASLGVWLFAFYPLMGNDYKFWVPLISEGRIAWSSFGVLDYDFSPLRCLGLPAFASPNSLLFSLQHGLSLLGNDLLALTGGIAFVFAFAFVGALRLFRHFGLPDRASLLMATGWCLQGWACSRVIAGHLPFVQLLLAPWLLYVVIAGRASWIALLAAAFGFAHMLYSGAFYSFIITSISLGLCLFVLSQKLAEPLCRLHARQVARNLLWIALLVAAMAGPKALAAMDFLELFPREARLAQVPFWRALGYAAGNVAIPFPVSWGGLVGWPFGNWESYQFLYPGLFFVLAVLAWQRGTAASKQAGIGLLALLVLSALFTSGLLAPVFAALPVLESLHVNPRWNAMILLPAVLLACVVIADIGFLREGEDRVGYWVLLALFALAPLQFLDRIDMRIGYLYHDGVHEDLARVDICYEPIFGYGLERFPLDPRKIDWLRDEPRDPRCLLASHDCRPGQGFERAEDREALERYALVDERASVLRGPSLAIYLVGFCALVYSFAGLLRAGVSGSRPREGPPAT